MLHATTLNATTLNATTFHCNPLSATARNTYIVNAKWGTQNNDEGGIANATTQLGYIGTWLIQNSVQAHFVNWIYTLTWNA